MLLCAGLKRVCRLRRFLDLHLMAIYRSRDRALCHTPIGTGKGAQASSLCLPFSRTQLVDGFLVLCRFVNDPAVLPKSPRRLATPGKRLRTIERGTRNRKRLIMSSRNVGRCFWAGTARALGFSHALHNAPEPAFAYVSARDEPLNAWLRQGLFCGK
jgi:hypothetical protein